MISPKMFLFIFQGLAELQSAQLSPSGKHRTIQVTIHSTAAINRRAAKSSCILQVFPPLLCPFLEVEFLGPRACKVLRLGISSARACLEEGPTGVWLPQITPRAESRLHAAPPHSQVGSWHGILWSRLGASLGLGPSSPAASLEDQLTAVPAWPPFPAPLRLPPAES